MRRTDRLFELIQIIRDGRLHRAEDLAQAMGVSVRTIYRDLETLVLSGIPVEGERGVGYILRAPVFLPPMTLTQVELEALHLGAALVQNAGDPELRQAAARVVAKVDQALPETRKRPAKGWETSVFGSPEGQAVFTYLPVIRRAVREKQKLEIDYGDAAGSATRRIIRPLHLEYWGQVWTCTAWCERRTDFRTFRTDRIRGLLETREPFVDEPGKRMRDFLAANGLAPNEI